MAVAYDRSGYGGEAAADAVIQATTQPKIALNNGGQLRGEEPTKEKGPTTRIESGAFLLSEPPVSALQGLMP